MGERLEKGFFVLCFTFFFFFLIATVFWGWGGYTMV